MFITRLLQCFSFLHQKSRRVHASPKNAALFGNGVPFGRKTVLRSLSRIAPFNISSLSDFENVILEDTYVSIRENLLNLKIRKERLVYKPVIEEYGKILAFGPKKKFEFPLGWNKLYPLFPRLRYYKGSLFSPHDLVLCLQESGYQATLVPLQKNAYRYKITENLQLELSHITVYGRHWYSLCVEGLSVTQVRECAHLIVSQKGELRGYAEFLNK